MLRKNNKLFLEMKKTIDLVFSYSWIFIKKNIIWDYFLKNRSDFVIAFFIGFIIERKSVIASH